MKNSTKEIVKEQVDDLSNVMKMTIGAAVLSMMTSVSTYHLTPQSHYRPVTAKDLTHALEREREVLHGHSHLGRIRYATVSGSE